MTDRNVQPPDPLKAEEKRCPVCSARMEKTVSEVLVRWLCKNCDFTIVYKLPPR